MREAAGPELAVGVRLSADELTPDGLDAGRCAEIAAALAATGLVDFASCVLGHSAYVTSSTWIVPPPPLPDDALEGPLARMRAAVDVPLIGTGGVHALEAAERLVAGGAADAVGMTRALIADPALVAKAAAGRAAEVLACVGCNQGCIGHYHAGVPIGCLVNPRTGRERTLPARAGGAAPLRVAVVGAGPAGVAAALEAAAHGDTVTLFERDADIGGQLRLAGRAPGHHEMWRRWHASAGARLAAAPVELRLQHAAGAEDLEAADVVVLATGARPYRPPWADGRRRARPARRLGGDRQPRGRRRSGAGGRLGRRLGRPRRGRGAGGARARGHARVRRAVPGRDAAPVPAQPLPRPLRRARESPSATTRR